MSRPVLYVLAGPNGIGKTTATFNILPRDLPVINSDEIAKQFRASEVVKVNAQEYGNREAQKLLKQHLGAETSFATETNLADEETRKFLKGVKTTRFNVHLIYLTTDDLALLHKRIQERTLRGEHFIRPDIVEERYHVSLKLLAHYFTVPDVVELIDNSLTLQHVAVKRAESYEVLMQNPPAWFATHLLAHFSPPQKDIPVKELPSVEDVRNRYRKSKER